MDSLPNEILERIFYRLQKSDLQNARLVCKRWRKISYSYSINEGYVTLINDYSNLIEPYSNNSKFASQFKPINLKLFPRPNNIRCFFEIRRSRMFWKHRGYNMRTLELHMDRLPIAHFREILQRCPNLQELTVVTKAMVNHYDTSCSKLFRRLRFYKLSFLNVIGNHNLLIPLLLIAIKKAKLLTEINLSCCTGCHSLKQTHTPLHETFYFKKQSKLKRVSIHCTSVCNEFIKNMTECLGKKLESLSITSWKFNDLALKHIEERCKNLTELQISLWNYDPSLLIHTFLTLTKLTAVSLFQSYRINDELVTSLGTLPSLTHLKLSNCFNVTNQGILGLFRNKATPTIIELRLINLRITDCLMFKIARSLHNLKVLNVSNCRLITTGTLKAIAKHIRSVQCLTLFGCYKIDFGVRRRFFNELPPYINLMKGLCHFSANGLTSLSSASDRSLQLPNLKVLDFSMNPTNFDDLIARNPSLKYVNSVCCETKTVIDAIFMSHRRKKILDCYTSPFGPCFVI